MSSLCEALHTSRLLVFAICLHVDCEVAALMQMATLWIQGMRTLWAGGPTHGNACGVAFARALLVLTTCVQVVHAEEVVRAPVEVRILAINDFHGNLMPPPGGIQIPDPDDRAKKVTVPAGGAEHMAALIKELRAGRSNTIFVAAGDLIGASPLLSSLFHDEPTIDSLSLMGLDLSSVGNHEFDKGKIELLRMQYGGCHADGGCRGPHRFQGAKFHYLAANVIEKSTGKTLFPAYDIRNFDGVPVAFIGLTTRDTRRVVSPSGTAGLDFGDEATNGECVHS
jgi:5'-nucleotidase